MAKIKARGTLVLPFRRINDLLRTVDTGKNRFHQAREAIVGELRNSGSGITEDSIDFSVTGNRIHVTCEVTVDDYKDARKQSFDTVYAVISQLMTLSLKAMDIENEDSLISVKDIEIIGVDE
jgi:hypothetical protein